MRPRSQQVQRRCAAGQRCCTAAAVPPPATVLTSLTCNIAPPCPAGAPQPCPAPPPPAGQRVTAAPFPARAGNGTWQQFVVVDEGALLAVPDKVSDEAAAQFLVSCPGQCAGGGAGLLGHQMVNRASPSLLCIRMEGCKKHAASATCVPHRSSACATCFQHRWCQCHICVPH